MYKSKYPTCLKSWETNFTPQFYIQLVYKAPLYFTLRIKIWVVAYKESFIEFLEKHNRFFSLADATIFLESFNSFFVHKKLKKTLSKVAQKYSFFALLPWAAQTTKNLEFMIQNVP